MLNAVMNLFIRSLRNDIKSNPRSRRYAEDFIKPQPSDEAVLALTQEDIYGSIYPEVRDSFRDAMKSQSLSREQILYIKMQLNKCLGEKRKYYNRRYKNDAHEIYSKLRSPFLDNSDLEIINRAILTFLRA